MKTNSPVNKEISIMRLYLFHFRFGSAHLGVLHRVPEVLLCQPRGFLISLRDVDALDFEDDRAGAVVAAGDHHTVVVRPAFHNGPTLQRAAGTNPPAKPEGLSLFGVCQLNQLFAHLTGFFQIQRELLFMVGLLVLGVEACHAELAVVPDLQRVEAA